MTTKLRDLIRNVRSCKTAAEERALVQREKALIRNSFTQNEDEFRSRNVAKLLFINMLGHDTDFGQMECLKLITSNTFSEKRIGYLGLTQLFNEKSEVLMMATHRMRIDLTSQSNYVVALALSSLSEICTADMCRELSSDVAKLMASSTVYIKKKASLAATRIIRKVPEKIDEYIDKIEQLMEERQHSILLSCLSLIQDVVNLAPQHKNKFKKFVPTMGRILKGLVTSYSSEYDISGISDPFLQVEILKFFRLMAVGDQILSDDVSEILAQVATNTSSNKNAGNAVLFECVKTIMAIESATSLKDLGINILGKFLSNKDSNSRYVSLYSLQKVLKHNIEAVQKHRNIILDCLKENDNSIKRLALDLLYLITNESNIKSIVKEMLNYLLVSETDFLQDLTWKICSSVEKFSPNRRWHIDTIIRVLTLAGNYVKDESISSLIHLISATPQLQTYSIHKIFFSLRENINQEGLVKLGLWCMGEYGSLLVNGKAVGPDNNPITVSEEEVLDLIEKIVLKPNASDIVKEYAVTCLIKLYVKYSSQKSQIMNLIDTQTTSSSLEVQQRACEYIKLIESDWDHTRSQILEPVPVCPAFVENFSEKTVGDIEIDEIPPNLTKSTITSEPKKELGKSTAPQAKNDLLDLDDILGGSSVVANNMTSSTTSKNITDSTLNLLGDLLIGGPTVTQPQQINPNPVNNLLNLYGTGPQQMITSQPIQQQNPAASLLGLSFPVTTNSSGNLLQTTNLSASLFEGESLVSSSKGSNIMTAFEDENLEITFELSKESADTTVLKGSFNNKSSLILTDLVFQVAVLKHLKLTMNPINNNKIPASSRGVVTQSMKIQNSLQGKKGIAMKLKIGYNINGQIVSRDTQVSNFPEI